MFDAIAAQTPKFSSDGRHDAYARRMISSRLYWTANLGLDLISSRKIARSFKRMRPWNSSPCAISFCTESITRLDPRCENEHVGFSPLAEF
jgi:hypothetical protein